MISKDEPGWVGGEHNPAAEQVLKMTGSLEDLAMAIRAGQSFEAGPVKGYPTEGWPMRGVAHPVDVAQFRSGRIGHLDTDHAGGLMLARYVVMAGATPIAWLTHDGWVIPEAGLKNDLAEHQDTMRQVAAIMQ